MKRKSIAMLIIVTMIMTGYVSYGAYFGTFGFVEYTQPNDKTFMAKYWGDEFEWHFETSDGYAIVHNPNDNYHYYAQLDQNGDYTWTNLKVGIDDPSGLPLHLDRSPEMKAEIEAARAQFRLDCESALGEFLNWQDNTNQDFLTCGVILVETPDRQSIHEYKIEDFNNMMNTVNYYKTSVTEIRSPDGDEVFGSIRDYFEEVSRDEFYPFFVILNNPDPLDPEYPEWVFNPNNFYGYGGSGGVNFFNDCIDAAVAAELNLNPMFDDIEDLIIILGSYFVYGTPGTIGGCAYPEYTYSGSITPDPCPNLRGSFWMSEQSINHPLGEVYRYFIHIGTFCHEYAHLIGLWDHTDFVHYCLMGQGNNCGPLMRCECPSHMGIYSKDRVNWVSDGDGVTVISNYTAMLDLEIGYSVDEPDYYRLEYGLNHTQYYLENRHYADFNSYLMGWNEPETHHENMLLVHRVDDGDVHFQPADPTITFIDWYGDDGDPFPGVTERDSLTPTFEYETPYDSTTLNWYDGSQNGIAFLNIESDDENGVIRLDVFTNYWEGEFDYTSFHWLGDNITIGPTGVTLCPITSPATFTLEEGSIVNFRGDASITVSNNTSLVAEGTELEPITFKSMHGGEWEGIIIENGGSATFRYCNFGEDVGEVWAGIKIRSGGSVTFEHCNFKGDENTYIYCLRGTFSMTDCTLENMGGGIQLIQTDDATIEHTDIDDSDGQAIYALTCDNLTLIDNNIDNNDQGGIYLNNCTGTSMVNNIISNNGDPERPNYGGMHFDDSSPTLKYNTVEDNDGYQLGVVDGSTPLLIDPESVYGAVNTLTTDVEHDYPIYAVDAEPSMKEGHNNVINQESNSTILIYDATQEAEYQRDIQENWWGTDEPQEDQFYPSTVTWNYDPWDMVPNTIPGGPGPCTAREDSAWMFFVQALSLENQELYSDAIDLYQTVAESFSDLPVALSALARIKDCAVTGNLNLAVIRDYFSALSTQPYNDDFCRRAELESICLKIHLDNYYGAIEDYEDILLSGPSFFDSIQVVIDAGMVWLLIDLNGAVPPTGPCNYGRIPSLRPSSVKDYRDSVAELWALGVETQGLPEPQVPSSYQLYQNYPNPFNPVTTIRYGLPEAAHVKVIIYNILGREVLTLVDEDKPAGYYSALWDSRSHQGIEVSSGVYFYRIEANDFVDVKKMVLLR